MISSRIETLRKTFFELQRKLKAENPSESDALNAYLNFLEQYHSALLSESNCKTPDFHNDKNRVEKEIVQISERIVRSYIKDFFPSLETFIRKYGSSEDTSEEGFSIQGGVDQKSIDGLINDLSGQSLTVSLNKLSVFCEKQYTGYSLKSLLKKFMS
jgi:molecular chaperone GrpE (heat shock protein)